MSKAVMRSLPPQLCERIANGKQTMLVVKQQPKLKTPYKEYIYCTKKKYAWHCSTPIKGNPHGKVIGEYIVGEATCCQAYYETFSGQMHLTNTFGIDVRKTCLTEEEIFNQIIAKDGRVGTAWLLHISNLVIYDKPKELGEFRKLPCEKSEKYCENCKYKHRDHNGEIYCKDDNRAIINPPRSWYYVEV